jgi:dihydroorotate dehydrogenase
MTMLATTAQTLFRFARPLIHRSDAESAHKATIAALAMVPRANGGLTDSRLATRVAGIDFPNPVGVAPGFDKDGQVPHVMPHFGFGFCEVGTLTPLPQAGNPRPRLFRLTADRAVINRMGFNNGGLDAAVARLERLRRGGLAVPLGINIGANKDSADRILDYVNGLAATAHLADYVAVNISSPNTPGLRALQDKGALEALLDGVLGLRSAPDYGVPVFLKVAPDLEPADIDDIVEIALRRGLDALIVSNTTISRPALRSCHANESGGLSGAPLRDLAQARLADFHRASGGGIPLVGVGGIASAQDAYARIRAGASLVQIYSAMVFEGPALAARIATGLSALLERDGFASVAEAVGTAG